MSSDMFLDLVQHEFKGKGSWKKNNRTRISKGWWLAYCLIIVIGGLIVTTYFATRDTLQLNGIWYVTMAFPYWIFFVGYGSVKKEWENETYGWWLTLPYSRFKLLAAKWLGNCLKVWLGIVVVFVLASLYVIILTLILDHYSFSMALSFMITGINWLTIIAGLTPFIIAAGMLTVSSIRSSLKPLTPVLFIIFFIGMSSLYQYPMFGQVISPENVGSKLLDQQAMLYHYPWEINAVLILSWAAAYGLVHLSAYLFDKKLEL